MELADVVQERRDRQVFGVLNGRAQLEGDVLEVVTHNGEEYALLLQYKDGKRTSVGYVLRLGDAPLLQTLRFDEEGGFTVIEREDVQRGILDCDDGRRWEGMLCRALDSDDLCPYGEVKYFDEDGVLVFQGTVAERDMCGYGVEYDQNGRKRSECACIHGKRYGVAVEYDRNGSFSHRTVYVANQAYYDPDLADRGDGAQQAEEESPSTLTTHFSFLQNSGSIPSIDFSVFSQLRHLNLCSITLADCVNVDIADLSRLETITVSDNAFCLGPDLYPYMPQCSQQIRERSAILSIRSCPLLCSVSIGAGSFSSFSRLALCGLNSLPS